MVNECVEKLVSPKDIEMTEETAEKADQETKDEGVEGNFQKYITYIFHCNIGKNKSLQCIEQDIL